MWRAGRIVQRLCVVGLFASATTMGCASESSETAGLLRLDIDRAEPRPFIAYYFGGLVSEDASDPFEAGVVSENSGSFFVDTTALYTHLAGSYRLEDVDGDGVLTWEELEPFLKESYYNERAIPLHLDSLRNGQAPETAFTLSVDGVMTSARRHIRVPLAVLRAALARYVERGNRIIYPQGTVIVAEHEWESRIVEQTAMIKRGDGFWDYAVYDSTGALMRSTQTPPKPLAVPTQCAGCHLGSRLYEPEKSFPAAAGTGPTGQRMIHWNRPLPSAELVGHFDEHRKRSDGILGIYGTMHVFDLITRRETESLDEQSTHLLEALDL